MRNFSYIPGQLAILGAEAARHDRAFEVVNPSTLKKWATGSGRAKKPEMIARATAILETNGVQQKINADEADAVCIAAWAITHALLPREE